MDNYKYYPGTLAYDFDMFMPKKRENEVQKAKVIRHPAAVSERTNKVKKISTVTSPVVLSILVAAFVFFAVCSSIYLRAEITSADNKINQMNTQIKELDSERVRLECELERKISYKNLEESAKQLGMQKVEKSQVVYIKTNSENIAINKNGEVLKDLE